MPHKNVKHFYGLPLLVRKIQQLRHTPGIDEVLVSSDSTEYLALAAEHGAKTHLRAAEYCIEVGPGAKSFGEVVANVCEASDADIILWAPCTSPLVRQSQYEMAVEIFKQLMFDNFRYDSVISGVIFKRYMLDAHSRPINYEFGVKHVPSQQLPPWIHVVDAIQIAMREDMIQWKYFHGPRPRVVPLSKSESIDIDDEEDFLMAEGIAMRQPELLFFNGGVVPCR